MIPSLFKLEYWYHRLYLHINSRDDLATLCKNLVNIVYFYTGENWPTHTVVTLTFQNALEVCTVNGCINSGDEPSTL